MRVSVGGTLGRVLGCAILVGALTARPALAQETCHPSWLTTDDIKTYMTDHPFMVRGFAAPESTVVKAVEAALVAAGFPVGTKRKTLIFAKPSSVEELKDADAPAPRGRGLGRPRRSYKIEQLSAYVRKIDSVEVVFLTYVTGKSESNSGFVTRGTDNFPTAVPGPDATTACDAVHYKDILDRVGQAIAAK